MNKPKYVAEGFLEDVSKIMAEFVEECSVEFVDFARIWKNNHFSLVFMGRPDLTETSEFTNEIFRITSGFLFSPSYYQRICAVYLLYALYRNQIANPPIKVRIEMRHWMKVKDIYIDAFSQKYKSLLYVIDYLVKYGFEFVAHQTLKGPLIGSMPEASKNSEIITTMKSAYKSDFIEYSASNNLEALKDLHTQYLEIKRNLAGEVNLPSNSDNEVYKDLISKVNGLINPSVQTKKEVPEELGSRRAKLKAQSFLSKARDRFGNLIEDDEDIDDPCDKKTSPIKKNDKNRRTRSPRKKGKVGRPSKKTDVPEDEKESNSDNDEIDITHLLEQQKEFFLPPDDENKKLISKAGRHYYKLSPKRDDNAN